MRRRALIVLAAAVGVTAVSGVALAAGALSPLPLSARVIQHGELPGFGPFGPPQTTLVKTAKKWVSGDRSYTPAQASAAIAALQRGGFKTVLVEQLGSLTKYWGGVSWVMQLGSAASARAQLAADVRHWAGMNKPPKNIYTAFPVSTIPGARGYFLGGTGGNGFVGDNVEFADGPFLYLVGDGWKRGMNNTPLRSSLIAAAGKLYKRVHNHPA
jgi:hypothetical protein